MTAFMNVLGKRLHSCVFREISYQINYQNKSKATNYRVASVTNHAANKHNSNNAKKEKKIHIKAETPEDVKCDWVGPPDFSSNIRPVKLHIPADESQLERNYRLKREEIVKWNHDFWTQNNANFLKEKEEFIKEKTSGQSDRDDKDPSKSLTPEEMSVFYREFLQKYYKKHLYYNMDWYKRNIQLLWPALQVAVYGVKKKMFHKKT
ncbi:COA8 family protein CBG23705, mitochondrial-like [Gigantopelta aegis]|uniref:COA8 family protein CBG23705, mitochondrial-like n=1 Tax=Gigantopelta aegis TaxID=1735272 RepID=UPI001B88C25F|nr:COA8 family protein CBG23705, mitochondrial-like [Gigantopelta aegis]